MKIKSDFITNSSSSAFVIIGVQLVGDRDYDEIYNLAEDMGLDYFKEEKIIGKVVARIFDDDSSPISKDFSEIQKIFEEVEYAMKELDIHEKIELIAEMIYS